MSFMPMGMRSDVLIILSAPATHAFSALSLPPAIKQWRTWYYRVLQTKIRFEDPSAHTEELGWIVQPCVSWLPNCLTTIYSTTLLLHGYSWVEAYIHSIQHFTLVREKEEKCRGFKMKDSHDLNTVAIYLLSKELWIHWDVQITNNHLPL